MHLVWIEGGPCKVRHAGDSNQFAGEVVECKIHCTVVKWTLQDEDDGCEAGSKWSGMTSLTLVSPYKNGLHISTFISTITFLIFHISLSQFYNFLRDTFWCSCLVLASLWSKSKGQNSATKMKLTRWIWARQLKPIAVGMWIQGWPLLTESSVVSRWGEGGKWGKEILPLFYFYLGRNLGSKIARHARDPPRRVKMS